TAEVYLAETREVLAVAAATGHVPGAVIAEAIPSVAGQVVPPEGWLAALCGAGRGFGAVPIADEVQVGVGRVGTDWWAFGAAGAVPDIVTLGKPIGTGHQRGGGGT